MTVFFFGTNFTAVKIVVESFPPILFAATRFTLAGCLLFLFVPFIEPGSRLRRDDFLAVLGLGVVGITLTQTVFTLGVSLTTAANTALVYSTAPVWGLLLGFVLGLERPRLAGVLGIGLSLVGVGPMSGIMWGAAVYSALCSSAFGFAAWGWGVSHVGANRVLIYQYLVTLTGVSTGILLLGEDFGVGQLVGAVVILAGVYLARRR